MDGWSIGWPVVGQVMPAPMRSRGRRGQPHPPGPPERAMQGPAAPYHYSTQSIPQYSHTPPYTPFIQQYQ